MTALIRTGRDLRRSASFVWRLRKAPSCYRYWYRDALESTMDVHFARAFAYSKVWELLRRGGSRGG